MLPATIPVEDLPPYLAGLNPRQRDAVMAVDGPVLVLSGAGTGKTRVLTTRLAHILMTGRAHPGQVLAVTFTNKAAREMKERIGMLLNRPVEGWWLGTFHSLAARILRKHAERIGLEPSFTILDEDDHQTDENQVNRVHRRFKCSWYGQESLFSTSYFRYWIRRMATTIGLQGRLIWLHCNGRR